MAASSIVPPPRAGSVPRLGHFELHQLLGKSSCGILWRVHDPRGGRDLALAMPRQQPGGAAAVRRWTDDAQRVARLSHPGLAPVVEIGALDDWPYVAHELGGPTLAHHDGGGPADIARWMVQALEALAFLHDAGYAHHDVQPHMLMLDRHAAVRILAAPVGRPGDEPAVTEAHAARSLSVDPSHLQAQRAAAQRDVLSIGLVMHRLLAGSPAFGEADTARAIERLVRGGASARLPRTVAAVPASLRAIVDRACDAQPRQRYGGARTLARALEGWLALELRHPGGVQEQLIDRVRRFGVLPALPDGRERAARLAALEGERTNELAELVLRDLALALELLRMVNTAQQRLGGNGSVLTVRRAIAMLGLDGVRQAAYALREWPGPLAADAAAHLSLEIDRARQAGRLAQGLRPAGYDAEVVYLVTLLQNLGRLVVRYHLPDDAAQIQSLHEDAVADSTAAAGLDTRSTEDAAACAVLGVDFDTLAAGVARHFGFDESVLQMMRRLPLDRPVRPAADDDELLRALASAANEAIDALRLPAAQVASSLERVAQRYGRVLGLTRQGLHEAVAVACAGASNLPPTAPAGLPLSG